MDFGRLAVEEGDQGLEFGRKAASRVFHLALYVADDSLAGRTPRILGTMYPESEGPMGKSNVQRCILAKKMGVCSRWVRTVSPEDSRVARNLGNSYLALPAIL